MTVPIVRELTPVPDVMQTLRRFADVPGVILFDSARQNPRLGRYSFLSADPVVRETLQQPRFGTDPFEQIRSLSDVIRRPPAEGLPPFQGGWAGLLGYELGEAWERLPRPQTDEFAVPALALGLYDWTIAWDHTANRCWVISQGLPEPTPDAQVRRAQSRLAGVMDILHSPASSSSVELREEMSPSAIHPLSTAGLYSDFTPSGYLDAVARIIEYIRAGDIFQANLSQRLLYRQPGSSIDLYDRLRSRNAAPFAAYLAHDDWQILSASPERFLRAADAVVETRPIKGTRKRASAPEADLFIRDELRESDKDRAENVMIVDLLRNDLSRVCRPGTVSVPQLCAVETYETVQHLVSEVRGELQEGQTIWDVIAATFPGGSITGAPKIRAMEIIAELEPTVRGPYCGSLMYTSCSGASDSSILIRTFTCRGGWVQCPAGGGIVADSDPTAEYDETLQKAAGMLRAFE